jgi:hypothetical protein
VSRLAAFILLAALIGGPARAGEDDLPFSTGDSPVEGWVVEEIIRHAEFARFSLKKGETTNCAEIRYKRRGDPQEWTTRRYRIQPCPGQAADEPFLRALLGRLRDWEQAEDHTPFVVKISRFSREDQQNTPRGPGDFYPYVFYQLLNGAALAMFLALLVVWVLRFRRDRVVILSAAGTAISALVVLLCVGDPSRMPTGWITILHEGYGYQNIMQLTGLGAHSGDNFLVWQELWAGGGATAVGGEILRSTVFVNLCLGVVNIIAFFVAAWLATRRILVGVLLSILMAGNICFINSMVSETPAQLVLCYFFMFALAAACINAREKLGRIASGIAMLQLLLVGLLIYKTREAMIVLVLPVVLIGFARLFSLDGRFRDIFKLGWGRVVRHWRWVLPVTLVVAAGSTYWWADYHYPGDPRVGWAIDGLFPFNPSFLTPPWFMLTYLPLGLVLLFILGVVHSFRRPLKFFLLPLALLILWRTIYSATHGWGGPFYERFRFLTLLTPICIFLAAFGWQELKYWLERISWLKKRFRLVLVLLGLTFLVWSPLGWGAYFDRGHQLPQLPRNRVLLSRNQQTEVRYLMDLMDRYPECVFITRNIKFLSAGEPTFLWGWFGKQMRMDLFEDKPGETLEAVANEYVPDSPCVLFYFGLDCNKDSGDCCAAHIENRLVLEENQLENLQYTDFHEADSHPPKIRLAVLWVR